MKHIREYITDIEFEGKEIEFKLRFSDRDDESWCKTVAAFANTIGGSMFLGVDNDGFVQGFKKTDLDKLVLKFDQVCGDRLEPHVLYRKKEIKIDDDTYVLQFKIEQNSELPVWFKRDNQVRVVYIRREAQTVLANPSEISALILSSKQKPFDSLITEYKFDETKFSNLNNKYKEKNNTQTGILLKQLQSKGAVTNDGFLTNSGLLFMDNTPLKNSNVACRIWPGLDKGTRAALDRQFFQGDIISVYEFARTFIIRNIKHGFVKEDSGRKNIISYPERAIEEALINAIAHRDYSINGSQIDVDIYADRIEIVSPGNFLLSGEVQDYDLNSIPSRRRNESICDILDMCNLMERSGSGFEIIQREYMPYGEEYAPRLYSNPSLFRITLMDLSYSPQFVTELNAENKPNKLEFERVLNGSREHDDAILFFCFDSPKSKIEIMSHIKMNNEAHFRKQILKPLLEHKLLLTTQASLNAPNQKYFTNLKKVKKV